MDELCTTRQYWKVGGMKAFYSSVVVDHDDCAAVAFGPRFRPSHPGCRVIVPTYVRARASLYMTRRSAAPRVVDVDPAPVSEFIEALSVRVHEMARAAGGSVPYTVIREVAENFIHADFAEPVVSILDHGCTIRFADQGPGIADKDRALLPGFTTARGEMKRYIRGVGSGLPIVRDYLVHSGGSLSIEDNLGAGSVVTIRASRLRGVARQKLDAAAILAGSARSEGSSRLRLSPPAVRTARPLRCLGSPPDRSESLRWCWSPGSPGRVLWRSNLGSVFPLPIVISRCSRKLGLIASDAGKRTLTPSGLSYLGDLMNRS